MYQYNLWIRLPNGLSTANTIIYADNDYAARQLGESMYGVGNVLNYTRVS
jgi:hypothetical protein